MASNFSNYFQKAYTRKPHFDELVYGFNGTSGSQRMDGSGPYAISWAPVTGTAVATGVRIESSYVLSPVRHGQLTDTFYAPPDHYVYGPREVPLVKSNFTGSIVISSNRDEHSRIFSRYQER